MGDTGLAGSVIRLAILIIFALYFGLPLLWLLLAPSKRDDQLLSLPPLAFGSLARYAEAWSNLLQFEANNTTIITWAFNSLYYSSASLLLTLIITLPAGYALAIMRFRGRSLIMWATLITMMIPPSSLVLPLFLEMNFLKLVNTSWSVILPPIFYPFGVYLSYVYYSSSLPPELLQAARVDGCSEFQAFWYIGLPLSRTILGLLAFLSFIANWNNYFLPFVMLTKNTLFPLPLGIQAIMTSTPVLRPTFGLAMTGLTFQRAEAAMAGLFVVLPVVIVFLLAQRYVVSGSIVGAIKE